jgi:hypothetical protein
MSTPATVLEPVVSASTAISPASATAPASREHTQSLGDAKENKDAKDSEIRGLREALASQLKRRLSFLARHSTVDGKPVQISTLGATPVVTPGTPSLAASEASLGSYQQQADIVIN